MSGNAGDKNLEKLLIRINNLKDEFIIRPSINSLSDIKILLDKKVNIKHLKCNYEQDVILRDWLNSRKDSIAQGENHKNTHFCKKCINKLKKQDLQEYINNHYNGEFILVGEYTGYKEHIELKHTECGETFIKTPSFIKSKTKRVFCKHCGKSDSIYEKSVVEKRNKELKDRFEKEGIITYTPLEDSPGLTKKMKFKHLTCGNEFESTAYEIYTNYVKNDNCPKCFRSQNNPNKKESNQKSKHLASMRNRYRRFIKFSKDFDFEPQITSFEDFKTHYEGEFTITHKDCGRSVKTNLSTWSKQRAYLSGKVTLDGYSYLCPFCSEELRRNEFQDFLNKKFNKEFLVVGKYRGVKEPIDIKHIKCGEVFQISPDNARQKVITCRGCGCSDKKTEKKLQKERNKELIKKLKANKLSGFKPLEDTLGVSKTMKFEHVRCGNTINVTPQSILRLKNKDYCPKCPEKLLSNETDVIRRTQYAQQAIDIINNNKFNIIGLFDDDEELLYLSHKDCLGQFPISKRNLFFKEIKCPHCETNNFKNNRYISIKEKIKSYEEVLNNEYKILRPFSGDEECVPIQHVECGHIFERTISTFLRSKNKLFCPKCRRERKLNEINNKLFNKYKGEFEVCDLDNYNNFRTTLDFVHKECGTVFSSNFDKMLRYKSSPCPKCNPQITTLQKLKSEVYRKYKGKYIVVGEFNGNTKKTSFRHKHCGKLFFKTPYNFLNSDIPCPHCQKEKSMLGLKKAQEKVEQNSGDLFTLNGIYRGIKNEIPVSCNNCNHVFISTPKNMFKRKSCPNCNATKIEKE